MPPSKSREPQRIAKLLARAGTASRRDVERMIAAGRIAIDGVTVETPATLLESLHGVTVDGQPVAAPAPARLFRYHKPAGFLTAARDPGRRPTIYDRMPEGLPRLMPVGRLDLSTEGLLLLTTDGELKRQLELPATGVERTYRARAYGEVSQAQLEELMLGIEIDGIRYGSINANLERRTGANTWIEMTLTEGKNREVRRVLEHLGLRVSRLIRTRYGPFHLDDLPEAETDEIRQHDLVTFRRTLEGRPTQRPTPEGADPAALKAWRRDPSRAAAPRSEARPRPQPVRYDRDAEAAGPYRARPVRADAVRDARPRPARDDDAGGTRAHASAPYSREGRPDAAGRQNRPTRGAGDRPAFAGRERPGSDRHGERPARSFGQRDREDRGDGPARGFGTRERSARSGAAGPQERRSFSQGDRDPRADRPARTDRDRSEKSATGNHGDRPGRSFGQRQREDGGERPQRSFGPRDRNAHSDAAAPQERRSFGQRRREAHGDTGRTARPAHGRRGQDGDVPARSDRGADPRGTGRFAERAEGVDRRRPGARTASDRNPAPARPRGEDRPRGPGDRAGPARPPRPGAKGPPRGPRGKR